MILKGISRLKKKIEILKNESSKDKSFEFIIENLFKIEDFKIEITRSKFEELCMDLWEKCIDINKKIYWNKMIKKI